MSDQAQNNSNVVVLSQLFKDMEAEKGSNHVLMVQFIGIVVRSLDLMDAAIPMGSPLRGQALRYAEAAVAMSKLLCKALGVNVIDAKNDCDMLMAINSADSEAN